jgi:hypothetical protein
MPIGTIKADKRVMNVELIRDRRSGATRVVASTSATTCIVRTATTSARKDSGPVLTFHST